MVSTMITVLDNTTSKIRRRDSYQQNFQQRRRKNNHKHDRIDEEKKLLIEEYDQINLPLVDRKDISSGPCIGKGSFSKVYKIRKIREEGDDDTGDSSNNLVSRKAWYFSFLFSPNKNKDKKKYALKMLRNSTVRKGEKHFLEAKKDMKQEIQNLSTFHHPNIVNVYGYGVSPPTSKTDYRLSTFLVIDRVESTLYDRILDWRFLYENRLHYEFYHDGINCNEDGVFVKMDNDDCYDHHFKCAERNHYFGHCDIDSKTLDKYYSWLILEEKINIVLQIADALQYMHNRGYVYRDLKPHNTGLMNPADPYNATVKLFDFGTCRQLPNLNKRIEDDENDYDDQCYKMSFVGSPRYMAPEIHGGKKYNQKADVYSWSMLFFEILTLEKAYPNYDSEEYFKKVFVNGERPRPRRHKYSTNKNHIDGHTLHGHADSCYDLSIPEEIQSLLEDSWEGGVSERCNVLEITRRLRSYHRKHSVSPPTRKILKQKQHHQHRSETMEETMNETMNETVQQM